MGGLFAILLVVKAGQAEKVKWDASNARFKVNGKIIPITAIRKELSRFELSIAAVIDTYNNKLWTKEWTIFKWRVEMEKLIENSHMLLAAFALGGLAAALGATSAKTTERRIERDMTAIKRYVFSLENNLIVSLPMMGNRSRAYLRSFMVTYHLLSQRAHILAGYTEARRMLSVAEHCRSKKGVEGCMEVWLKRWMPIRQMPPIGTLVCMQWCKCHILYRKLSA